MARLFFHKPKFGVLYECTNDSAINIDVEEHLYKLANDMGITFVTSSQMDALVQEAKLYRTNWHYKHFWKDYIFLDRCVWKNFERLVVIFLDRLVVIFLDGCIWKIFG